MPEGSGKDLHRITALRGRPRRRERGDRRSPRSRAAKRNAHQGLGDMAGNSGSRLQRWHIGCNLLMARVSCDEVDRRPVVSVR